MLVGIEATWRLVPGNINQRPEKGEGFQRPGLSPALGLHGKALVVWGLLGWPLQGVQELPHDKSSERTASLGRDPTWSRSRE